MGANNGSGWPLFFWCAACKKKPGWRDHKPGWNVVRTGRTKPYTGGNRGVRGLDTLHEYKCKDCGHVGWSRHVDIARKPLETDSGCEELEAHRVAEALADAGHKLNIMQMTREELLAIPFRDNWRNEAGPFTSIVIVPLDEIHESGYRKMDFIGCRGGFPVCRLSGQSDNLSLLGVGGSGRRSERHLGDGTVVGDYDEDPPRRHGWQIDCLRVSGLLHLWDSTGTLSVEHLLNEKESYSTFDLYSNPTIP